MIIDCFPFHNELDLLEIRLEELKDAVDWFVLVEAGETYSGQQKPFLYEAHRHLFERYNICYVKINGFPHFLDTPWHREEYTRDLLRKGLDSLDVQPGDVVMLSDLDEIPRGSLVRQYAQEVASGNIDCCVFRQTMYFYHINLQADKTWHGTRMIRYEALPSFHILRTMVGTIVSDGGWHFRYQGGVAAIQANIAACGHTDRNRPEINNPFHIAECMRDGKDLCGADVSCRLVSLDKTFPHYLLANQVKYRHLIASPVPSLQNPPDRRQGQHCPGVKLDVGSGGKSHHGEGWLGVDAYVPEADIHAFMWDLPFDESSIEEIFSSHALEHVAIRQVQLTLQEWYRVLISGGKVTIRVPDLAWCLSAWLANPTMDFEMMRIFGNQAHDGEFHKCGFTGELLAGALGTVGFRVTHIGTLWSHGQQTLEVQAYKP